MRPLGYFHESRVARSFLRRIVPVALILLAAAGSVESSEAEPTTSTGVNVTKSVPFVRESIDEIRALAPFREKKAPENRAIHVHPNPRGSGATRSSGVRSAGPSVAAPVLASSPAPSAPALVSSFAGLGNPSHSEDVVPPDTMGAVGPNHLVSLLNSDFGVFNKTTGAVLQKISLQSFWGSLGTAPGQPADYPFDTKVLYDPASGRFYAMTLGGTSAPNSWILVAVSASSDPTGAWNKWAIDADRDNDQQLSLNWADFPGMGLDGNNLYISTNMFSNSDSFRYSKVWVIPKAQLLSGSSTITWTEIPNPAGSSFNMQPAHTFGAAPAEYFLFEGTSTQLLMARIDNTAGTPVWHAPTAVPIAAYPFLDDLPQAPQAGSDNTIHTSDPRLLNVVYRNGALWTVHAVQSPATVKTEIAWYRITPGTGAVAEGRISDPVRWYYYPSIAVNQDNVAAVGFSGSSSREYIGGYYTIVRPSPGVAEAVSLLKTGEAPYYKTLGGTYNRWGDYSATVVDPADDVTFWTLQEYAQTPDAVTGGSRWGTWWGRFRPSDVASPSGLSATAGTGVQVTLAWTDSSSNELGFKIERRRLPAGAYSVIATVGANTTSFADNTDTGLVASASYHYRVESYNAGGGAYSNEAYATTSDEPPAPGGNGGGGGGCLSITRSGSGAPDATSLAAVGILLLPACALGLRRFSRRRKEAAPIRHPLC